MGKAILNPIAVVEEDLTTPSSTAKYPLGLEVSVLDSSASSGIKKFMYVKSHGALTVNQPYVLSISNTGYFVSAAPATLAAPGSLVVVPQVAFTSGYYGFVQFEGECECLHIAETYAAGDMLQVLNAGTALVVDGSTGATAFSVNTCGITVDAGTTAVAKTIILYGKPAVVAAT